MVEVIIDKEQIRDMLFVCGVDEMKILVDLMRERQDDMLKRIVDAIKTYENDPSLKNFKGAINSLYGTKKEIEDLL